MSDLGPRLKRAREGQGIALRDIALRTKISVSALEALERNDVSKLPGGIFGRAFVRSYASEIGLDPDAVVAEFALEVSEEERRAAERGTLRVEITADDRAFLERQGRAISTMRIVVICAAVLSVVFLAWRLRGFWLPANPVTPVETVQPSAPPPQAPVPASRTEPAPAPPAAVVTPPSAATPVVFTVPQSPGPAPPPESRPGASPAATGSKAMVVDVEITEDTWLFVQADGERVVSQMFRAGEQRRFEGDRVLFLDVGNAGGLRWSINGTAGKALGRSGAHQRVTLTPRNLPDYLE